MSNFSSLADAVNWLENRLLHGDAVNCPCCRRKISGYKRALSSAMARALILLSRAQQFSGDGWVDIKRLDVRGGDYGRLVYWQLIERRVDKGKKNSGVWRLTPAGIQFVSDHTRVRKYAHVLRGRVLSFSGPEVGIRQCLGAKFDYQRLMTTTR